MATTAGNNDVSSFDVRSFSGQLSVNTADAAPSRAGPIDVALTPHDEWLYALTGAGPTINAYQVSRHGDLEPVQTVNDLPPGASGCVAF